MLTARYPNVVYISIEPGCCILSDIWCKITTRILKPFMQSVDLLDKNSVLYEPKLYIELL
ncbi:hypothetical protein [Clostridium pasteurianum]|uniref:hypothetical protein n=1 Tax=Clostridium pasteurianum TaxID=1501 RepID=UPI001FA7A8DF|nr:hypothetical protein [Clostridium pasteurianum]